MDTTIDLSPALDFLDQLRENNNKPWFEVNRPTYERARDVFERFIDRLINELRKSDHLGGLSARDCVARIYRDTRFSKDKSPYKSGMGANIAPGGRKSGRLGYYIHFAPRGETLIAGGLYSPDPDQLATFRRAIARDANELKRIARARHFVENFGAIGGEKLKTAPQGYDRSHAEIELLKLKQVTAMHQFSDEQVLSPDFPNQAVAICRAMKPFLDYLNSVLLEA